MRTFAMAALILLLLQAASPAPGTITTYAGPGAATTGGRAAEQVIDSPSAVLVDGSGGFYIASHTQHRVYHVTSDGTLGFVAGTGKPGFSGDGGPATSAQLNVPSGLSLDAGGNLYICDSGNSRVRRVTPNGVITTFAGSGENSYGGDGGPAASASLNLPSAIATDAAGNLYIADSLNERIRRVSNGTITTVAGGSGRGFNGDGGPAVAAQLDRPTGLATDRTGNLYVVDSGNGRIRKITPAGIISTVAGSKGTQRYSGPDDNGDGGPATDAAFLFLNGTMVPTIPPSNGIAVDANGNIYIADIGPNIRKVNASGLISSIVENGIAPPAIPNGPRGMSAPSVRPGLAVDSAGNLLIADFGTSRVRRVTPAGEVQFVAGTATSGLQGDGGPASAALFRSPKGLAIDGSNNLYVIDEGNARIRRITSAGVITSVAGNGTMGFSGDGGDATAAQILPLGIAADSAGALYIASQTRVRKVTPDGIIRTIAGNGSEGFSGDAGPAIAAQLDARGVAVDKAGNIYIADGSNVRVRKITTNGVIQTIAGGGTVLFADGRPATEARLFHLSSIVVDNAGNLYVLQSPNNIFKISGNGVINGIGGGDSVAVDASGNVYASLNSEVFRIVQTGVFDSGKLPPGFDLSAPDRFFRVDTALRTYVFDLMVVAGTKVPGFSGDGGPGASAQVSYLAYGLALDSAGNLYIADTGNHRIRKVTAP